jgi:DNA-binding IclR family transcriptional regulator
MPDDAIRDIVRRIDYHEADRTRRVALPDLMARIDEIRRDGYVFSRDTVIRGAGIVARLLPSREDGRLLAVGVSGPVERLSVKCESILHTMEDAAPRLPLSRTSHSDRP